jgi:hypothetical protein
MQAAVRHGAGKQSNPFLRDTSFAVAASRVYQSNQRGVERRGCGTRRVDQSRRATLAEDMDPAPAPDYPRQAREVVGENNKACGVKNALQQRPSCQAASSMPLHSITAQSYSARYNPPAVLCGSTRPVGLVAAEWVELKRKCRRGRGIIGGDEGSAAQSNGFGGMQRLV